MQTRRLARNLHLLAIGQPGNTEGGVVAVTAFDQIEVTDLENIQRHGPVRKYALLKGKQGNDGRVWHN
jgi:hypothetical protein